MPLQPLLAATVLAEAADTHHQDGPPSGVVGEGAGSTAEDRLGLEALRRLVASINRYLGEDDEVTAPLGAKTGPLQVESSRPMGGVWLLDQLWKLPGIDTALAQVLNRRRLCSRVSAVRAGRQPRHRAGFQTRRGRVGQPRRGRARSARTRRQQPGPACDGPARRERGGRRRAGVRVLRRRPLAQPRSRPALLRHHQHLLRA
ncbi:transposase [Streptomyces viridosporus ATCC 14672]|uniref:Transposase n=1 Tax=Streptomyces viridosporus (strain ATCC 14672 / DSM 40746 / JCM 4963 / KCTC 9882 / NRRL B-12104 / FH 1290) TaxID=566461 RepID=D6A9X8_STRV1|nr:transposase [Streptomyces viridosporus ATCC 14672]